MPRDPDQYDFFVSYARADNQEGWISLHELLNAIQIEVTGLADYYSQLSGYYSDLFELEAITGRTLVEFGPEEN